MFGTISIFGLLTEPFVRIHHFDTRPNLRLGSNGFSLLSPHLKREVGISMFSSFMLRHLNHSLSQRIYGEAPDMTSLCATGECSRQCDKYDNIVATDIDERKFQLFEIFPHYVCLLPSWCSCHQCHGGICLVLMCFSCSFALAINMWMVSKLVNRCSEVKV